MAITSWIIVILMIVHTSSQQGTFCMLIHKSVIVQCLYDVSMLLFTVMHKALPCMCTNYVA